jgi:hypothetical protein
LTTAATDKSGASAADDASALALALSEHADDIARSDNAVLYEGERVIWQKAPFAI